MSLGVTGTQAAQLSVSTGGSIAAALAPAAMIPVIGIGVAAVGLAIALIFNRQGPQQKIEASKIADQVEPKLKQNVQEYLSGPRTRSSQAAALASFDYAWGQLSGPQGWGNPALGEPGSRAIKDRGPGGTVPGTSGNWFIWYRDPISNDPNVQPDPMFSDVAAQIAGQGLLLPILLIAVALIL